MSPRLALVCAFSVASSAAFLARAEPRVVPLVGVEAGQTWERLAVRLPDTSQQEDRWLWNTGLVAGLGVRLPSVAGLSLRADSTAGLGVILRTGHGRLDLRETALLSLPLGAKFSAEFGLGAGVVVDTGSVGRSSLELALPLGVRFRSVELLYRPALALPLGAERSPVLGGDRELSARPGLVPFSLSLRFHLGALGFGG